MDNSNKPLRVLWFANTPGLSAEHLGIKTSGGGWMSSMQREIEASQVFQLGYVFYAEKAMAPFEYGRTWYFPVQPLGMNKRRRLLNRLRERAETVENLPIFLRAIDEFKPDIIHIHGTEFPFGLILRQLTHTPVVIGVQGNLTVYNEKYFSGMTMPGWWSAWRTGYPFYRADHKIWRKRVAIEQEIMGRTKFIFGRTNWDRRISKALAPQAEYFYQQDVIRPTFYSIQWAPGKRSAPVFFTTSSPSIYKGFEVAIDTARILIANGFAFEWQVAGLMPSHPLVRLICRQRGVTDLARLNISLPGNLTEEELATHLKNADVYVHFSHIENSPNSVCEAMLAGVPVIATFAGGTGSLIKDGEHGVLVQDGDPYVLAGAMQEVAAQPGRAAEMAAEARRVAHRRHDPARVVGEMTDAYHEIIRKHRNSHD